MKGGAVLEKRINRRDFVRIAGIGFAAVGNIAEGLSQDSITPEIRIYANRLLGLWYFDPVGLYVEPGQTVRWVSATWGTSVTAYHPDNDNRELRIPEGAQPFDSGLLDEDANTFEWTFDVPGTYDYFSRDHEPIGAVGRIVVGQSGGPAEKPLGYGGREGWAPIYPRVRQVLELVTSKAIVEEKIFPYPTERFQRRYPY